MGTGGFLNPPPGQTFDEAHTTPDIQMQGDPGTIKGANLDSAGEVCLPVVLRMLSSYDTSSLDVRSASK